MGASRHGTDHTRAHLTANDPAELAECVQGFPTDLVVKKRRAFSDASVRRQPVLVKGAAWLTCQSRGDAPPRQVGAVPSASAARFSSCRRPMIRSPTDSQRGDHPSTRRHDLQQQPRLQAIIDRDEHM